MRRIGLIERLLRERRLCPAHLSKAGRLWRSGFPASVCAEYLTRKAGQDVTTDMALWYLKTRWPREQGGRQLSGYETHAHMGDRAPDQMLRAMAARGWPLGVMALTLSRRWPAFTVTSITVRRYLERNGIPYDRRGRGGCWRYAPGDTLYLRWRPGRVRGKGPGDV